MMRKLFATLVFLGFGCLLLGQSYGSLARQLQQRIQKLHYAPRVCDDSLASSLMDAYLHEIDPMRLYFTAEDLAAFERHRLHLDEYILAADGAFLQEVEERYVHGLQRGLTIVKAVAANPLDFKQPDRYLESEDKSQPWPQDSLAQAINWRCLFKERVLALLYNRQVDSTGYKADQLTKLMAKEPEMREMVLHRSIGRIEKRIDKAPKFVGETFLKCLALQFDPHTEYFDMSEEKEFVAALSTQKESFGLSIDENAAGEVEIARIIPGGPAWKSGKLHAGDVLLSYSPGNGKPVEVQMSSAAEINARMVESDTDSMGFTVRKKDGQVQTVKLAKAVLRAEENLVKSWVLEGKEKVGYIQLPGFYQDWEMEGGRGCAGDVAKELVKLQKDGIEALVLDLRFNGGGSLTEATDLAGIFIDGGPLWISRNSADERFTIKDPNRGSAYTGPMIVLVNGASASASEFLCTALQDHHRAIIVGSTTFGKATSQAFYPLDPYTADPKGSVKITTHKYYRLGGGSHQFAGVTPDIVLKDVWSRFIDGEKSMPFALQPDTVVKKTYFTPAILPEIGALQARCDARYGANADFEHLDAAASKLKALVAAQKKLKLNGAEWFAWEEQRRALFATLDELERDRPVADFTLHASQFDAAMLKVDEYARSLREEMLKSLSKDLQLAECMHIIDDILHP